MEAQVLFPLFLQIHRYYHGDRGVDGAILIEARPTDVLFQKQARGVQQLLTCDDVLE